MSIIPLQPPRHVMNIIYGYQHSTVEKYHRFFYFFLRSAGVRKDHTSLHYPFLHAGTPADYLYATQSHTRARVHTYTDTDTYRHIHTPVMDFLETSSPKKDDEVVEEVYREKRLFRYFFSWFSSNVNTTNVCQYVYNYTVYMWRQPVFINKT